MGVAAFGRSTVAGIAAGEPGDSSSAGLQHRGTGTDLQRRLFVSQAPDLFDDALRSRAEAQQSLSAQGGTHPSAPDADSGGTGQGAQGPIHAALSGTAPGVEILLAVFPASTLAVPGHQRAPAAD